MTNQPKTSRDYTYCGCHNPILNILAEDLSDLEKIFSTMTAAMQKFAHPEGESLVISGGIIRPLIDGKTDTVEAIGIHKGMVIATGTLLSVTATMKSQGIKFEQKKLEPGQTLLPRLIEPHVHIVPSAIFDDFLDLGPFDQQI